MNKTTQNKLRKIAESTAALTDDEKALIVSESEKAGIEFQPNLGCENCYRDQAILLLQAAKKTNEEKAAEQEERAFVLRPEIDVTFCGIRICPETLTDELGYRLMELGFPTKFFVKYAANRD